MIHVVHTSVIKIISSKDQKNSAFIFFAHNTVLFSVVC